MPDLYREPVDSSGVSETPGAPPASLGLAAGEQSSVESEIAELEKQLAQKRALLGAEKEQKAERSSAAEKPAVSAPVLSASGVPGAAGSAPAAKPEVKDLKDLEKNQQLKNLIDLAFQKGISYASDVARDLDSPYLMDEFHDTLADKLHKELVERGKLEEI